MAMAAAAAAAVVGARRTRVSGPPRITSWASGYRIADTSPASGVRAACCTSVVLLCVGFGLVVASFGNDRQDRVQTYDAAVQDWMSFGRAEYEGSQFIATATLVQEFINVTGNASAGENETNETNSSNVTTVFSPWLPQPLEVPLPANNEMDWSFSDTEGGTGLEEFQALKFEAEVEFPSYYPNVTDENSTSLWAPLPGLEMAPAVRLTLTARTRNGSESELQTGDIPLFYEERVTPRTPAPENKCRSNQRGVWRHGGCYVVRALTSICVQVELNNVTQAWQFRHAGGEEGYGCDPRQSWSYATYRVDTCWGNGRHRFCTEAQEPHPPQTVEITVRSWRDPKLTAVELTRSSSPASFDFGTSSATQRAMGAVFLVLSGVMALPPVLGCLVPYVRKAMRERGGVRESSLEALSPAARRVGSYESS